MRKVLYMQACEGARACGERACWSSGSLEFLVENDALAVAEGRLEVHILGRGSGAAARWGASAASKSSPVP